MLDLSSQQAEANGTRDLCLAQNRSINKSETTDLLKEEKPLCASFPDEKKLDTIQDYPQPIPEGKQTHSTNEIHWTLFIVHCIYSFIYSFHLH